MQRRDFLKLCGAAGLGFAAPVGVPAWLRVYGGERTTWASASLGEKNPDRVRMSVS